MAAGVSTLPSSDSPARPDLRREVALGLAVFALYGLVTMGGGDRAVAAGNGRQILDFERVLRIDVEPLLNQWLAGQGVLCVLVNYEYAISYLAGAVITMAWLYVRGAEVYRQARTSFILINMLAVVCFAAYPVMPPRLMPELGFIDTVRLGETWGSWGSPLVEHADQFAAMPSLHVAWAMWVSISLVRASAPRLVQWVSATHVVVTVFVIMATANHYLLDAVVGALLAWACAGVVKTPRPTTAAQRVPAADAFFLAVETPAAPQHVGGLVLLDTEEERLTRDILVALVADRLDRLPRFRQRLSVTSRWRWPRWVDHTLIDWDWHIQLRDVSGPDGRPAGDAGLHSEVARIQGETLPRDRPMWRLILVHGIGPGRVAVIFIMHHVVADGIGTITYAMHLLDPTLPEPEGIPDRRPRGLRAVLGIVAGLVALATDGLPKMRLPSGGTSDRR
ncbi:MAG TPA: phosphatase PAP2 family protein, partial [Thermopolyspora sp.]